MSNYIPKVGDDCELLCLGDGPNLGVWESCDIKYVGEIMIVYILNGIERSSVISGLKFRPRKTDDEKAIDDLARDLVKDIGIMGKGSSEYVAKHLIKLGYHNGKKVKELKIIDWLYRHQYSHHGVEIKVVRELIKRGYVIEKVDS